MSIEVLSPAGSYEAAVAAVRAGADAIYLGAKSFSARRNATNFDDGELVKTVQYCHLYKVKVYVTVNIEVKDSEFADAVHLVSYLNDIGVDGLIVQDLGIARIVHQNFPDMSLHGSTQMSIHHPSALPFLAANGFSRIVTARELDRDELIRFVEEAKKYHMEVEHFVHGAPCVSVSGQCLLSSMIGQRSGNRGLCAQPCRLPFAVEQGNGHDLSLKDSSLFKHVKDMAEIGVSSLKIEGRMKRPEYVALATHCCREAVDGRPYDDQLLKSVFSRSGFTDGYHTDHLGRNMFGVRTEEDAKASANSFNRIHELYRMERQNVPLDLKVHIHRDQPIVIKSDGLQLQGDIPLVATGKPTGPQEIRDNLAKLGNTPYYLNSCEVDIEDGLYVRNSMVNALRRELVEQLNQIRTEVPVRRSLPVEPIPAQPGQQLTRHYARLQNAQQYSQDLEVDGLIIPINMAIPETDKEIIVEIPRWIFSQPYIEERLQYYYQQGVRKAYCNNISAVVLAKQHGFAVMGGNYLNVTNSYSIAMLADYGVAEQTASIELTLKEIGQLNSTIPLGMIGYGNMPLMLLKNCPLKNGRDCKDCDKQGYIEDRMHTRFPIRCGFGMSELLNSKPIYLADKMADVGNVSYMILYFSIESASQVKAVCADYRGKGKSVDDYTRGLYYRGVL